MSILTHRKLVKDLVKDFGLFRNLFTVFGLYHRINMGPVNRTIRKKYEFFWTRVRPKRGDIVQSRGSKERQRLDV